MAGNKLHEPARVTIAGHASALFMLPYSGTFPQFAGAPMAGPSAAVLGRATHRRLRPARRASVIRADGHFVRVGDDFCAWDARDRPHRA